MIELDLPSRGRYQIEHLVLDVNGTLAVDGRPLAGVAARLAALKQLLTVHLLTADTHGRQDSIDLEFGLKAVRLQKGDEARQKGDFVRGLGAERTAAMGNGANDADMLRAAAVGVAVQGGEGLAVEALLAADVVCATPLDALDLLLNPRRLTATLRK